jgi:hypothetical protein
MAFAKLFGEGDDQVVVIRQEGDEGPEIVVYMQGPDPFGVCSSTFRYEDDDEGRATADQKFEGYDEENAREHQKSFRAMLSMGADSD